MGYWIRSRDTSSTWSLRILLLVSAVIVGLLGMHMLAGHGTPAAGEHPLPGPTWSAVIADHAIAEPTHGCADCAEHASIASSCVLAPIAPAALPGPPAEDLRPALAVVVASTAPVSADPRPPSISVLCISRR
ncbi:DUF6153 family protein [Microbacterium azadirachtae]|uniref:DUF6153 family protein n=1 Tax=Microbacterium azadirachtae TaxID=582680 RepID=UPI0005ED1A9D|nr:DUF6153 family protein [Microbacterium azadirachtae]UXW86129.1 DUF6153 family protein [Microbacterium azadirachtae]